MDKKYNPSATKNLHDLAGWSAFAVQIIGYFPLTSKPVPSQPTPSKTFNFSWKNFLPCYASLLICASFTWCFVYFLRYHDFESFVEFKSTTEVAAHNLMMVCSTLSALFIKLLGLIRGKRYQQFWQDTVCLLDHFPITASFHKIASQDKLRFFLILTPALVHLLYFHVRPLLLNILDYWSATTTNFTWNLGSQYYLGLTFWWLFALLHVGNGLWLNFFVKIYTNCFESIAVDLKTPNFQNSNVGKSQGIHSTVADYHLRNSLSKLNLVDHEIARFNDFFGSILLVEVANCVLNLLVFSFFACLWSGRGKWQYFVETLVPLYLHGMELLHLGTCAEQLNSASEEVLNTLVEDVQLGTLSEEMFLKVIIYAEMELQA